MIIKNTSLDVRQGSMHAYTETGSGKSELKCDQS